MTITIIQLFLVKEVFECRKIARSSVKYVVSGFIMFVILQIMSRILPSNFMGMVAAIIAGMIIYFGLLWFLKDDFFINYVRDFLNLPGR